jgi:hypothetical protein
MLRVKCISTLWRPLRPKSGDKKRRMRPNFGVESAKLPAVSPDRRLEIGVFVSNKFTVLRILPIFGLFLQINVTVQQNIQII